MQHRHGFFKGFAYAANGIAQAIDEERNLRFHCVAGLFVLYFARFYRFTRQEYAMIIILICGVISLELVNSSIERAVEKPTPDKFFITGAVKDMAAGAVLVFSIGAAACGLLLFWQPAVWRKIIDYYLAAPWRLAILLAALVAGYFFIFRKEELPFEDR